MSAEQDVLISVKDLKYRYGDGDYALKGIDLTIKKNSFFAFIGQNGSGKTTLAKHFVGLLRPSAGNVTVCGVNTLKTPVVDLARHVGYVFQNANDQIFCDTVEKEVAYGPKNLRFPKEKIESSVVEALELLGLSKFRSKHPLSLGWGDRQKVAIASVLSMGPEILILDEPTTGQDMRGSYEILNTCSKLHEEGKTVIIITHNMQLVTEFCHDVVVLYDGEILAQGKAGDVFLDAETLQRSYIEPPQITRLAGDMAAKYPGFPSSMLSVKQMSAAIKEYSAKEGISLG